MPYGDVRERLVAGMAEGGGARKGEIGGDGSCQGRKRDIECWLAR